jgi:hypothetical protein
MEKFLTTCAQSFLNEMRRRESHESVGKPCTRCLSPTAIALARCQDCLHSPVICVNCIKELHTHDPLHSIETWDTTQGFFSRRSLELPLYLGHDGTPCRNSESDCVEPLLVIHTNGLHLVNVIYCNCSSRIDRPLQLFSCGLFPASFIRPSTAFTLATLRDFNRLHSQAQVPASDYLETLNRKSSDDLLGCRLVSIISFTECIAQS